MKTDPVNIIGERLSGAVLAAYRALERNVPFALWALPGHKRFEFIAQLDGREPVSDRRFVIVPWLGLLADGIVLRDTVSVKEFLKNLPAETLPVDDTATPWDKTTDKFVYKGQVLTVINHLEEQGGGKTVISRVVCGSTGSADCSGQIWMNVLDLLSGMNPDTFRFLYFTPETGAWMAATPELLLDIDRKGGWSHSMALAGTRRRNFSSDAVWDEKNIYEHDLVLEDICEHLRVAGVSEVGIRERDLVYGDIVHRCHDIRFKADSADIESLLDAMSPTPALGGYPRESAIKQIAALELHPRNCYGGYVMLDTPGRALAYVNLRCVHFLKDKYCIYTGGGITPDSKPEDEWKETELKASRMVEAIRCRCEANRATRE